MSLQVWLPLNGTLDNQGLSSMTFSYINNNGSLSVNTSGKIGKCYERTASAKNDLIRSSSTINLSGDLSMCCWAYVIETIGDTANGLVTNHSHADNTGVGITVKQISTTDYRISCNTGTGSGRTFYTYYGTTNIKNAWHHLCLTYSKSAKQLLLYVDGKVEYTLNNYVNASKSDYIDIFNWSTTYYTGGEYRPKCRLNDVRIYNHTLSLKEIKEISKGLILHYLLNGEMNVPTTNLLSSTQSCLTPTTIPIGTYVGALPGSTAWVGNNVITYSMYIKNISNVDVNARCSPLLVAGSYGTVQGNVIKSGEEGWSTITVDLTDDLKYTGQIYTYIQNGSAGSVPSSPNILVQYAQAEIGNIRTTWTLGGTTNGAEENLVIGLKAGGRTTVSGSTVTTTGENADTYFYLLTSKAMELDCMYKLSCLASNIPAGTSFTFPIASQSNTGIGTITIKNGYNEFIFKANSTCVNAGTQVILDDTLRSAYANKCVFSNFKLQKLDNIEYDCSGYKNNGFKVGAITVRPDSPRYSSWYYFNSTNVSTYTDFNNPHYIHGKLSLTNPETITMSWWSNISNSYSGSILCTSTNSTENPSDYTTSAIRSYDDAFRFNTTDGAYARPVGSTSSYNTLIFWTLTYDGNKAKVYKNGVLSGESSLTGALGSFTDIYIGYDKAGGCYRKVVGYFSDFRVYATALSADDIKELYKAGAHIDNHGNVYGYELKEE